MLKLLSPKSNRNVSRIIPYGLIWFVYGIIFFVIETAATGGLDQRPSTAIEITPKIFIFGILANTILGLIVGAAEVLYLNRFFVKKSLTRKILKTVA